MTLGYALVFVLIGHILADFYAQTDRIAREKRGSVRFLALHCGLYALCLIPFCLLSFSFPRAVGAWVVLALVHAAIDAAKMAWERRKKASLAVFCFDQALHVLACLVVSSAFFDGFSVVDVAIPLVGVMGRESFSVGLSAALVLLVVWRPAAIFVRLLLGSLRMGCAEPDEPTEPAEPRESTATAEEPRTGTWIGILERTIIGVLTLCGQFEAIAFVLTAKSIARFKRLSDDKGFAECYLVGTLASTAIAILASLVAQGVVGWS